MRLRSEASDINTSPAQSETVMSARQAQEIGKKSVLPRALQTMNLSPINRQHDERVSELQQDSSNKWLSPRMRQSPSPRTKQAEYLAQLNMFEI